MNLFDRLDDVRLANRALRALATGPLDRQEIKARLGLPPRARKINDVLWTLRDAGLVTLEWTPALSFRLGRAPRPGELTIPRREFHLLGDEVAVGAGIEVRAVRFLDSDAVRFQVRRVSRFPSGAVRAQHLLGLSADVARRLGEELIDLADNFGGDE